MDLMRLQSEIDMTGRISEWATRQLIAEVEKLQKEPATYLGASQDAFEEVEKLKAENEQLQVQLAGCSVAALGMTIFPAKQGDYGWSASYQDTLNLRIKYDAARKALEVAREVFRNSERPARLGADREMIAEALLIGLRGCDKALKGDSSLTPNETPK